MWIRTRWHVFRNNWQIYSFVLHLALMLNYVGQNLETNIEI